MGCDLVHFQVCPGAEVQRPGAVWSNASIAAQGEPGFGAGLPPSDTHGRPCCSRGGHAGRLRAARAVSARARACVVPSLPAGNSVVLFSNRLIKGVFPVLPRVVTVTAVCPRHPSVPQPSSHIGRGLLLGLFLLSPGSREVAGSVCSAGALQTGERHGGSQTARAAGWGPAGLAGPRAAHVTLAHGDLLVGLCRPRCLPHWVVTLV